MKEYLVFLISILMFSCSLDEDQVSFNEKSFCSQNEAIFSPDGYNVNHLGGLDMDKYTLLDIYFIDDNNGFQLANIRSEGKHQLLKTNDGGVTWEGLELPHNPRLKEIIFKNADEGAIFTYSSNMYKTTDGGKTWKETASQKDLNHYAYDNNGLMYASSFDEIIHVSYNDGESWTELSNNNDFLFSSTKFSFEIIGEKIYALGKDNSVVVISLDGEYIGTLTSDEGRVNGIHVLNEDTFIFETYNSMSITKDGGVTWSIYYEGIAKVISFISENESVILMNDEFKPVDYFESYDKIAYTTDGGTTWIQNENTNTNLLLDYKGSQKMSADRAVLFFRNCIFEVKRI
jgi:photosystem II stability/assembly factor-like uncharacterized protein